MASPPPASTTRVSHTGAGDICPACTRISRGGGKCRRTRGPAKHSASAAPPSILGARGSCSAPSGHLLAPVMPPSRPAKAPPPLNYHPAASQPEMRSRRECGQPDVAASPGSRAHQMGRRLARHISGHMGEALPALARVGASAKPQPRLPATWHDQPTSPPSVASRPRRPSSPLRGLPGASAACRPALQTPARPAPCRPSPTRPTRTSARSTNPRATRPNGGPAAQLRPPADAPDR